MPVTAKKSPVYAMRPNPPRIVNAILHVINDASRRRTPVTQYDIVKTIFLADRSHLNKFGRPITYDDYVAMKFGPVPSAVYDLLKENRHRMAHFGMGSMPWTRRPAPEFGDACFVYESPTAAADEEVLSPSDMEELTAALNVVKALGFSQIKKLTHEDRAYIDAWEDDGDRAQFPMSYALLFDEPNERLAKELSFLSEHV